MIDTTKAFVAATLMQYVEAALGRAARAAGSRHPRNSDV
jgi:hypothetical protein